MTTLLRWFLILVAALVSLSVLLSIALLVLVDPNDYREEIAAALTEQTGRPLVLEGDLSLKTFPCCGLQLGAVRLGNPPGWLEPDFARVAAASVSVQVWPLLRRQELRVGRISLDGVNLLLISRRDGSVNWDFAADNGGTPQSQVSASGPDLASLDIAGISITNSQLEYRDEATGESLRLTDLNLEAGAIRAGEAFSLEAALTAEGLVPDLVAALRLQARVLPDIELFTADMTDLKLNAALSGLAVPGGKAQLDVTLARLGNVGADIMPVEAMNARLSMAGAAVNLSGSGQVAAGQPTLNGALVVESFSPRKWLVQTGGEAPVTRDPAALSRYEMRGDWSINGDRAALENIVARLDDSVINGWLRVASIEKESLALDLQIDSLNADRYLAPETPATGGGSSAGDDALDLPVEDLRKLDLSGKFTIGALQLADARLSDVSVKVVAANGLIRLQPLTARLYGGSYAGDVRLDVRGPQPRLSVNETFTDVQLAALLADTSDKNNLAGTGTVRITATAVGNSVNELLANLEGDTALQMQEGLYRGVDIWYEIRKARAMLKRDPVPAAPLQPQTELSEFAATARFSGGKLSNRDLQASLPFLRLSGSGDINLLQSTLDYSLQARVVDNPRFADGEDLSGLTGLTLPIKLKGALDSPSVSVDVAALAAGAAGQQVRDRLIKRLGLEEPEAPAAIDPESPAAEDAVPAAPAQSEKPRDALKRELRDLINR